MILEKTPVLRRIARRLLFVPRATRSGRLFFLTMMGSALVCAGLEAYRVHGGIVTNYGADLFGTAWCYTGLRLNRADRFPRAWLASPVSVAVMVFVVGTASEFLQRVHLILGTYDPFDIVTYALAVVGCVLLEHFLGPFVIPAQEQSRGRGVTPSFRRGG